MSMIRGIIGNQIMPKLLEQKELYEEEQQLKQRQDIEKKNVQQKQIRALRNRYRGGGGLLGANPRGVDLMNASGQPTKFGD